MSEGIDGNRLRGHFYNPTIRCCDLPHKDRIHSPDAIEAERPGSSQTDWVVRLGHLLDWTAQIPEGATMLNLFSTEGSEMVEPHIDGRTIRPVFDSIWADFEPKLGSIWAIRELRPIDYHHDRVTLRIPAGAKFVRLHSKVTPKRSHCISIVTS